MYLHMIKFENDLQAMLATNLVEEVIGRSVDIHNDYITWYSIKQYSLDMSEEIEEPLGETFKYMALYNSPISSNNSKLTKFM